MLKFFKISLNENIMDFNVLQLNGRGRGGGGRHICPVKDSNPTDVTVCHQNIPCMFWLKGTQQGNRWG